MGSFDALGVALSGLNAQRQLLDVAGQNVANASTVGYTRQRVLLSSVGGSTVPGVWSGTTMVGGVRVDGVDRLRDALLEVRGQQAHASLSLLTTSQATVAQVEQLFTEPSDNGFGTQLSAMWSAFQDVANQPGDLGTRQALLQKAGTVADWLNSTAAQLGQLSDSLTAQAKSMVSTVNETAQQLADLNAAISRGTDAGLPTNELADKRDLLALSLADLVGGVTSTDAAGTRVMVGGTPLVSGSTARAISLSGTGSTLGLTWAADGSPVQATGGQLPGLVVGVATGIPAWTAKLDSVASALATSVNALHAGGFDLNGAAGGAFFTGTTAGTLRVAVTDPRAVAASSVAPGASGPSLDAGVALRIAGLAGSSAGADAAYRTLVTEVGLTSQTLTSRVATQQSVTTGIDNARESQSGVNVDEEMASILTYQRAYEAASRVLTAVDQALDQLINHTGLVGRA